MRLARHALAVLAVVAVIMALGLALRHTPAASLVTDRGHSGHDRARFAPPIGSASTPVAGFDHHDGRGNNGFDITRVDDLAQTLVILGGIVAAVVVIDRLRRRRAPIVDRDSQNSAVG